MELASRLMVLMAAALFLVSAGVNFRASKQKRAPSRREGYLAAGLIAVGLVLLVVSQIV